MAELNLRRFFSGKKMALIWDIAGNLEESIPDLTVWLLDKTFLLFTGKEDQAQHLIISSNGGYIPSAETIPIPEKTEFVCLGPHSWDLYDLSISNITRKRALPYVFLKKTETNFDLLPFLDIHTSETIIPKPISVKMLSGTSNPEHIRNYNLSEFLGFKEREKSYRSIADLVARSRIPTSIEEGQKPIDIETIYNRFDILTIPSHYVPLDFSLKNLFQIMEEYGISYQRITLSFFRSHELTSVIYYELDPHCDKYNT
ncbi:MAG TPA: hypothetical protein VGZ69_02045 [Candidatus Rhabdochlamydia sp.]|jgi:hypothetical protein|nr:hypothetical protein [Candidatus Rhabdochlamydia sp.]